MRKLNTFINENLPRTGKGKYYILYPIQDTISEINPNMSDYDIRNKCNRLSNGLYGIVKYYRGLAGEDDNATRMLYDELCWVYSNLEEISKSNAHIEQYKRKHGLTSLYPRVYEIIDRLYTIGNETILVNGRSYIFIKLNNKRVRHNNNPMNK